MSDDFILGMTLYFKRHSQLRLRMYEAARQAFAVEPLLAPIGLTYYLRNDLSEEKVLSALETAFDEGSNGYLDLEDSICENIATNLLGN